MFDTVQIDLAVRDIVCAYIPLLRNLHMNIFRTACTVLVASALLTLAGCGSTDTQSSTGEYIDDAVITTKVKAAIFNDENLKVTEINVETFKGVVQLSGFVSTGAETDEAAALARGIEGVVSVRNDILVK